MIVLKQGDMTQSDAAVWVAPANPALAAGGGCMGAIQNHCDHLNFLLMEQAQGFYPLGISTGQAVAIETSLMVPNIVVHAVAPNLSVYPGLDRDHLKVLLKEAYLQSLKRAHEYFSYNKHKNPMVAIPLLGSGIYGWSVEESIIELKSALMIQNPDITYEVWCYAPQDLELAKSYFL